MASLSETARKASTFDRSRALEVALEMARAMKNRKQVIAIRKQIKARKGMA